MLTAARSLGWCHCPRRPSRLVWSWTPTTSKTRWQETLGRRTTTRRSSKRSTQVRRVNDTPHIPQPASRMLHPSCHVPYYFTFSTPSPHEALCVSQSTRPTTPHTHPFLHLGATGMRMKTHPSRARVHRQRGLIGGWSREGCQPTRVCQELTDIRGCPRPEPWPLSWQSTRAATMR